MRCCLPRSKGSIPPGRPAANCWWSTRRSTRHVSNILSELRLPKDAYSRLQDNVRDTPIFADAGADAWTAGILGEVLTDTWFTWGHEGGLASVRGGTRPGDNLADMLFSFLFSEVLNRIRAQLQELGHVFCYPWHDAWNCSLDRPQGPDEHLQGPSDVTWMDDLALLFRSRNASGFINGVQEIATILLDECVRAVLLPNLGRGKTEAVLTLVGHGSRKAKLEHCHGVEPTLGLRSDLWPEARLRVVPAYKHLGGIIHHTCTVSAEVRSRIGSAWAAFRKHQRRVFTSRCASTRDKSILFESLVLSTMSFGIGTWPVVCDDTVSRFQSALLGMSRLMLRPSRSFEETSHMCPGLVLALARVPTATVVFHVERLRHLALLVRRAKRTLGNAPPKSTVAHPRTILI